MEEEENGTMERIEALEELVGELAEGVKGLMETMSSLMEKDGEEYEEDGEVDEEETNMASEDKEMSARLEKLEKQLAAEKGLRIRAEANAKLDATGLEFAADRREALVALSGVNEKAFAATVAILSEHAAKARKMTAEANDPFAFATQEVGAAGHSPTEPRDGFRAFCAEMKKSGVKTQHEALKQLAAERRINLMDGDDVAKKSLVLAEIWPGN